MQNSIETILEEQRHISTTQAGPPIQNLHVAQAVHPAKRHVEDNAAEITKKIKVDAPDLVEKGILVSFLIGLIQLKNTSTGMKCQMHKEFHLLRCSWLDLQKYGCIQLMKI